MKTTCSFLLSALCLGLLQANGAPPTPTPTRYFAVCTTEMDKTEQYAVMAAEDFKQLTDEVKTETAMFPRAMENARVEWMKDEILRKKIFPKSSLSPRKVDALGPAFTDEEKAQKKIDNIADAQAKRDERKQAQQKQRGANRPRSGHQGDAGKHEKGKDDPLLKAIEMVRTELDKLKESVPAKRVLSAAAADPK